MKVMSSELELYDWLRFLKVSGWHSSPALDCIGRVMSYFKGFIDNLPFWLVPSPLVESEVVQMASQSLKSLKIKWWEENSILMYPSRHGSEICLEMMQIAFIVFLSLIKGT